ncbi:MAG: hypothetical protein K8R48_08250 [Alphaproteobacteria bacterium]|nr:hypothetical protein [Alphaproteobacteria bacterium]
METVEELRHSIKVASLNHDVWDFYDKNRAEYLPVLNDSQYLLFFVTSIHAHFVACITPLYRLYETRNDTHNIPRFLKSLEDNKTFSEESLKEINELYARAKPIWVKVSRLKNEVFGHRSKDLKIQEVPAGVENRRAGGEDKRFRS